MMFNNVFEAEIFFFRDVENHEVELVLPMGNVVDLTFIKVNYIISSKSLFHLPLPQLAVCLLIFKYKPRALL